MLECQCQGCKATTELELLCRTCIGGQADAQGRDAIIGRDRWRARAEKAEAERDRLRGLLDACRSYADALEGQVRAYCHQVYQLTQERDQLHATLEEE